MDPRNLILGFVVLMHLVTSGSHASKISKYSKKEQEALKKLRILAADIIVKDESLKNDVYLFRWLTSRNMDVGAAYIMLRDAYKWREVNKVDSLPYEKLEGLPTSFSYPGKDKEGNPVVLLAPGSIDMRALLLTGRRKLATRGFIQMLERGHQLLINNTKPSPSGELPNQMVSVLDYAGFSQKQHLCVECIEGYLDWFRHYESYYPQALKYIVFINVNRVGTALAPLLRPVMTQKTRDSMKIFGMDKAKWKKFLLSIIDADQLPFKYGGTLSTRNASTRTGFGLS